MKAFSSPIFALFLLLTLSSVSATTLEEICKKLGQGNDFFDVNFCLTSLQVDPNSRKADTLGLAIIAANLAKTNVTHNKAKANELLNSKDVSREIKKVLQVCVDVYDSSVDCFANAIPYIKSRDYKNANNQLSAALTNVDTCIDTWQEESETSPMATEDADAEKLSALVLRIAALLQ